MYAKMNHGGTIHPIITYPLSMWTTVMLKQLTTTPDFLLRDRNAVTTLSMTTLIPVRYAYQTFVFTYTVFPYESRVCVIITHSDVN